MRKQKNCIANYKPCRQWIEIRQGNNANDIRVCKITITATAKNKIGIMEQKFKILSYAGKYVDVNSLNKGIYATDKPFLYNYSETIESLINIHPVSLHLLMTIPQVYSEILVIFDTSVMFFSGCSK